ncbi:hypothetical protein Ddc_10684 [Ditylenchus destructor]|nr:hypothetical protein Ddc_10684 [Ditylenchus destructor]
MSGRCIFLLIGFFVVVLDCKSIESRNEQPIMCSLCYETSKWVCDSVTGGATITSTKVLKILSKKLVEECERLNINIPDLSCADAVSLVMETVIPGLVNGKLLPELCHKLHPKCTTTIECNA